eukprot:s1027_g13.t1
MTPRWKSWGIPLANWRNDCGKPQKMMDGRIAFALVKLQKFEILTVAMYGYTPGYQKLPVQEVRHLNDCLFKSC